MNKSEHLSIVVVGASGDLAKRKIYPALFTLFCQGLLPDHFHIFGYARSELTDEAFREKIQDRLSKKNTELSELEAKKKDFLARCLYHSGQYGSAEDFRSLDARLQENEPEDKKANRVIYMAIPPSIFLNVAESVGESAMATKGWTRVIIEKPFGKDSGSSQELNDGLAKIFSEEQIYRIDHYLGKELVQNLMVLRFANLMFEPIWNRSVINNVQITWKEKLGVEGRGGYFDQYGIIRDVMQNHLMQILSLVAMEEPVSLSAEDVRDEKVKLLKHIPPLKMEDIVLGQYKGAETSSGHVVGYTEDETVPHDSRTPTFAAAMMKVENRRWQGVPFLLKCGKAMDEAKAEIRIQFNPVPGNLFSKSKKVLVNELIIRVQPDEGICIRVMNKVPGLNTMEIEKKDLNMRYTDSFVGSDLPDAYERLILDVIRGDKSLFIRDDELQAAWDVFTPSLHEAEEGKVKPEEYYFGSAGPSESEYLAAKYNVKWGI